jgi:hypothetical protein
MEDRREKDTSEDDKTRVADVSTTDAGSRSAHTSPHDIA